jgi:hypothetical protein
VSLGCDDIVIGVESTSRWAVGPIWRGLLVSSPKMAANATTKSSSWQHLEHGPRLSTASRSPSRSARFPSLLVRSPTPRSAGPLDETRWRHVALIAAGTAFTALVTLGLVLAVLR